MLHISLRYVFFNRGIRNKGLYQGCIGGKDFEKRKASKKIILTRPAVEAGENLDFLPRDLKEKLESYLQPFYDALRDMISHEKLLSLVEKGVIEVAPLAFMRGRTLNDAFVILDEAQNNNIRPNENVPDENGIKF